ncbi:hypothetical protein LAZ67_22001937 [Cordylochernes scorpioides]|uniref:Transposase n=1 Tax=Cordylochernes scorpioides TaxID=51811 RepID=A0ABY6LPD3_9ARAC|nr:hypothetical protein LAZ67_22001937 [Cordylochernes scorpioides]
MPARQPLSLRLSLKKQRFQRLLFLIMRPSPHLATITHLTDEGVCPSDIACRLKINTRIVKQYRERGHYGMLPKSVRLRTVNTSATRKIIKKKKRIARNDGVNMTRIASDLRISKEIVQNIVKRDLGLRSYRLYRGKPLSEAAMKNRLDKAKKLLSMIRVGRLYDIVWTNEKNFTTEVAHNSQNHRQILPTGNKTSRKRRLYTRHKFPKSAMVLARVTSEDKTPLVYIDQMSKSTPKSTKTSFCGTVCFHGLDNTSSVVISYSSKTWPMAPSRR